MHMSAWCVWLCMEKIKRFHHWNQEQHLAFGMLERTKSQNAMVESALTSVVKTQNQMSTWHLPDDHNPHYICFHHLQLTDVSADPSGVCNKSTASVRSCTHLCLATFSLHLSRVRVCCTIALEMKMAFHQVDIPHQIHCAPLEQHTWHRFEVH